MMRRIGFRRLLPPVQLVLFAVLCFIARRERQRQGPCGYYWSSVWVPVFAQEDVPFVPRPLCCLPKAQLAAIAVDLPAVLVGGILEGVLRRKGDVWAFALSAPLVVLLWYWVGLWIDRRLGYVGLPQGNRAFPRVLVKVAYGCSVFTAFWSVTGLLGSVLSHHYRPDNLVVASGLAGWSAFLTAVTWSSLRRSGSPVPPESEAQAPHP